MTDTYVIDVQDPGNALDALMFVNNYELDRLFEIDCNNPEEQYFITGSKNSNQNV